MSRPTAHLPDPILIRETRELADAARAWREAGLIGFDSEFERSTTFYQIPALYQVAAGERCYLVDPLGIEDFSPLADVLEDPGIVKLAHACGEDAELLDSHLGVRPASLIDTQLLLAFCGGRYECGFAEAIAEVLDVELDKSATRSDWLARPLTDAQVHYAVADAVYLLPLFERLKARLEPARMDWVREESAWRVRQALPVEPDRYYLQIKGAWQLQGPALARLARLAAWRERSARALNRPRGRIVKDAVLKQLAEMPPRSERDLRRWLAAGAVRRFGGELLEACSGGEDPGRCLEHPPGPLEDGAGVAALRRSLVGVATRLGIAEELLATRRLAEQLYRCLRGGRLQPPFLGWRRQVLTASGIIPVGVETD